MQRIYNWLLHKSKIFRRYYKKVRIEDISAFLYDLELSEIDMESVKEKYIKKLDKMKSVSV